jgi:hypothetical protein
MRHTRTNYYVIFLAMQNYVYAAQQKFMQGFPKTKVWPKIRHDYGIMMARNKMTLHKGANEQQ